MTVRPNSFRTFRHTVPGFTGGMTPGSLEGSSSDKLQSLTDVVETLLLCRQGHLHHGDADHSEHVLYALRVVQQPGVALSVPQHLPCTTILDLGLKH